MESQRLQTPLSIKTATFPENPTAYVPCDLGLYSRFTYRVRITWRAYARGGLSTQALEQLVRRSSRSATGDRTAPQPVHGPGGGHGCPEQPVSATRCQGTDVAQHSKVWVSLGR